MTQAVGARQDADHRIVVFVQQFGQMRFPQLGAGATV